MVSTAKDRMLGVCGKEQIGLAEHRLRKRNHRLLVGLCGRYENPGVLFEQTQEPIFRFGRKMLPNQEISIRIVIMGKVGQIPRNEERYSEEKNAENALALHLKYLWGEVQGGGFWNNRFPFCLVEKSIRRNTWPVNKIMKNISCLLSPS